MTRAPALAKGSDETSASARKEGRKNLRTSQKLLLCTMHALRVLMLTATLSL